MNADLNAEYVRCPLCAGSGLRAVTPEVGRVYRVECAACEGTGQRRQNDGGESGR